MYKYTIIILFLLVSGCSNIYTQSGVDASNKNSFSTISTDSTRNDSPIGGPGQIISISKLDDVSLLAPRWESDYPDVVHVTPGTHHIGVNYHSYGYFAKACLWFNAIAGENYIVRKIDRHESVLLWIENIETRKEVGGKCN